MSDDRPYLIAPDGREWCPCFGVSDEKAMPIYLPLAMPTMGPWKPSDGHFTSDGEWRSGEKAPAK